MPPPPLAPPPRCSCPGGLQCKVELEQTAGSHSEGLREQVHCAVVIAGCFVHQPDFAGHGLRHGRPELVHQLQMQHELRAGVHHHVVSVSGRLRDARNGERSILVSGLIGDFFKFVFRQGLLGQCHVVIAPEMRYLHLNRLRSKTLLTTRILGPERTRICWGRRQHPIYRIPRAIHAVLLGEARVELFLRTAYEVATVNALSKFLADVEARNCGFVGFQKELSNGCDHVADQSSNRLVQRPKQLGAAGKHPLLRQPFLRHKPPVSKVLKQNRGVVCGGVIDEAVVG